MPCWSEKDCSSDLTSRGSPRDQNVALLLCTYSGVMAKDEWSKSYVIPSVLLSLTAAGLLVWHLIDPGRRIDAWAVTLVVVGFLPWLRTVFESISFPGGGEVKYQKLEATQEMQQNEIDGIRFVLAHFLPADQLRVLQKFAAPEPYGMDSAGEEFYRAKNPLQALGFIEPIPENWTEEFNEGGKDLKSLLRLTESGRRYLELRNKAESS